MKLNSICCSQVVKSNIKIQHNIQRIRNTCHVTKKLYLGQIFEILIGLSGVKNLYNEKLKSFGGHVECRTFFRSISVGAILLSNWS